MKKDVEAEDEELGFWAMPKEIMRNTKLSLEARFVFSVLWTRRNGENTAWPSQEYMADKVGCSVRSIQRYIKELEKSGLITSTQTGLRKTNRYTLHEKPNNPGHDKLSHPDTTPVSHPDTTPVSHPIVRDHSKRSMNTLAAQGAAESEINPVLELFEGLNPTFTRLFPNKSQRAALERLIKSFGREKVERMIGAAKRAHGQPYAPTITTPIELEAKLGQLAAWVKKEITHQPSVVVI